MYMCTTIIDNERLGQKFKLPLTKEADSLSLTMHLQEEKQELPSPWICQSYFIQEGVLSRDQDYAVE